MFPNYKEKAKKKKNKQEKGKLEAVNKLKQSGGLCLL